MAPLFLVLLDLESVVLDIPEERTCRCRALEHAVTELTGMRLTINEAGAETDYATVVQALAAVGLDGDDFIGYQMFKRIEEKALINYAARFQDDFERYVRPGLTSLLISCRGQEDGPLFAPLSTALEGIVRLWLARSDLAVALDLSCGGYSTWRRYRPDLIKMARERAGGVLTWPAERTVVVSSDSAQIAAAREEGVRAVFVGDEMAVPEAAAIADCVIERVDALHGLLSAWS